VMIVNETFARHYFADENPVGRRIGLAAGVFDVEIVGVVKDGKYTGLREEPVRMMYVPNRERAGSSQFIVLVRTAGEPLAFAPTLRRKATEVDRRAIVHNIATAQDQIDRSLLRERLVATISGLFGALALLLAAIGLYGVLSYRIAQRTRELGIRIAIGAEGKNILSMVLREAGWVLMFGIVAGLAAAWSLGHIVSSLLYGVQQAIPQVWESPSASSRPRARWPRGFRRAARLASIRSKPFDTSSARNPNGVVMSVRSKLCP
jgi:putative ABC transport system permease protein